MHQDATVTVTPIAACTAPTDSATTAAAAAAAAACQTGSCHCSGKHHADCFFHGFPPKNYSFFVWDAAHLSFPDCTLIISGKPDLINVFPLLKDGFY